MALKAAYRLLSNAKVTHENILHPHVERTRRRCGERGEYLLIEDTTALSFTHREGVHGMGPLTQQGTQGFLVHTNLAMRVENWDEENSPAVTLVGVFSQQCWVREKPTGTRAERKRDKRVAKKSGKTGESARWARGLQEMGTPPSGACWTLVADRECDIFEVLAQCAHQRVGWIIRAAQNRKTAWGVGSLFTEVAQAPVLGTYALELRARPGSPARVARVETSRPYHGNSPAATPALALHGTSRQCGASAGDRRPRGRGTVTLAAIDELVRGSLRPGTPRGERIRVPLVD
jgi:hypothetical protein